MRSKRGQGDDLRARWEAFAAAAPDRRQLRDDERTLRSRGGIDADWYSRITGLTLRDTWAARHYLLEGAAKGLPPHPFIDPEMVALLGGPVGVDPVAHYLRTPALWRESTHALFDTAAYVAAFPEALRARGGPPEHYLRVGLPAGVPPGIDGLAAQGLLELLRSWTAVSRGKASAPAISASNVVMLVRPSEQFARVTSLSRSVSENSSDVPGAALWLTTAGLSFASSLRLAAIAHVTGARISFERPEVTLHESWRRILTSSAAASVVLLDVDVIVEPGWLPPLMAALESSDVAAAGSVVLDRDGSVRSAGVAFCTGDGHPEALLAGFPIEDLPAVREPVAGLAGGALAMRASTFTTVGDLNGRLRGGLQSLDFALRTRDVVGGELVLCPGSRVIHWGDRDRDVLVERDVDMSRFRARWGSSVVRNEVDAWARRGVVVEHDAQGGHRRHLLRADGRLRWALKNPAPPGTRGERWGDTHFVRDLAAALRRQGQEVVVDAAPAFDRSATDLDDVVLLLRGVRSWTPRTNATSLLWVISHPVEVQDDEIDAFTAAAAASGAWAAATSDRLGRTVVPLLQATDPLLFHPDRAEPDTGPPLLFVGGARDEGRPLVQWAVEAGLPLTVIGPGWAGRLPDGVWQGDYIAHDELGAHYRAAGLVLCDHWADMAALGFISNRVFDVLAAGGRAVSDPVAGLADTLPGVAMVSGAESLREVFEASRREVFGDDAALRARALDVGARHSFDARAAALVEWVRELRG